jgi:DNA-binding MarR family transcriptional regulator
VGGRVGNTVKYKRLKAIARRALVELEAKGLVECLTPSERVGRIYRLTKRGQKALRLVKDF